jgi:hypothetical protein
MMSRGWRATVRRGAAVTLFACLFVAGLGAGIAAADGTPNDGQYTNTGTTEPTSPPTTTTTTTTTDTTTTTTTTDTTTTSTTTTTDTTDATTTATTTNGSTDTTDTTTEPDSRTSVAGASGSNDNPPTQGAPAGSGDTLPFTGVNLAFLVGLGGALVAAGLLLRRAGRRDSHQ